MSPAIRVVCPGCNARVKAPLQLLGRTRGCPRCKRRLVLRTRPPGDAGPLLSGGGPLAFGRD